MSKSQIKNSRRVTPWDDRQEKTPTQEFLSKLYKEHYIARHPPLNTTGEENLINAFVPETCPYCNGVMAHVLRRTVIREIKCSDTFV